MRVAGIVEVYHAELGRYLVPVFVAQQVIVGQRTQIRIFEIVNIKAERLFDKLTYKVVYHGKTLAAAWRSDNGDRAKYGWYIQPALPCTALVAEQRRQVHRIFVLDQACFLHKGFVFVVENVVQQVVPQKSPHPYSGCEHQQIAREQGCGIPGYTHTGRRGDA